MCTCWRRPQFYKCLDELKAACSDLLARGISGTGQGFDAPSVGRLGSHGFIPQHNPEPGRMRDAVLRVGGAAHGGSCDGGAESCRACPALRLWALWSEPGSSKCHGGVQLLPWA